MIVTTYLANKAIVNSVQFKNTSKINELEPRKIGLVLGTSKFLKSGHINPYYQYRVNAAWELFKAKKIQFVLISGDNSQLNYDEPTAFKEDLIKLGIPEDRIYLDYAGFRTLDSVVRAKEIFGLTELIFISQKFHNERAIYLAQKKGIDAIGFNARDVGGSSGKRIRMREYLARVKVFVDLLFDVQPKFLGKRIQIGDSQ